MSDSRPIGVFDSGVGGLTVLLTMQAQLPNESTIYLGDLDRCPYGPRPQEEVREFALQVGDFLAAEDIKLLVIACNTATAAAYEELRQRYAFPVVGVIAPGAAEAARVTRKGRIGVVATSGTVASGAYASAVHERLPGASVVERAASWLVPLVEAGHSNDDAITLGLGPVFRDLVAARIDTLILGCTHFPLLRRVFEEGVGPDVAVVDSATTTTREVERLLGEDGIAANGPPTHRFLVTGPSKAFADRADAMFHASPPIETVDLMTLQTRSA